MTTHFGEEYASVNDENFKAKYRASCYCGAICYEVQDDPVDAKICHCIACQKLHGAPMQWAAIFYKRDVRITAGVENMEFYNSELHKHERILPCKVSCKKCKTLIADEGRNMWLAFPSLFDFGSPPRIPEKFRPTCHIFYGMRSMDVEDGATKWSGHKNKSQRL
ncbi:GFA family protein [Candidatus Uabimicrobium amorphum]|uniref:Aldehyde-activating protein n=1 Tax=Uabimicrobium amorphum TaxID=2596890 RepID=A0A5S9F3T1_UABAM|nr:GFA family protein [Candidatus Uabimicrobium amorphum]BBM85057.1 aldehyde-activating protein [Candidatus Uabimicrobium amorphum]